MEWKQVIKINYPQLFFVFAAFFLMVLVSYISISAIVQRRLSQSVDEVMLTAEANIRAGLSEAEASMNHVGRTVRAMLDGGASQKEVLDYLTDTNRRMQRNDTWLFGFHGIYGYLRDEFIDSIGLEPGPEFIPQTRPWFDAAVRNTGETSVHTEPYVDALTGDIILTAVRNIHGASGEYYGILAIDMDTAWFRNYARSPRVGNGSYYIVLNQYMAMVGHPGDEVIGRQLHDICDGYREIYDRLMTRREISSLRIEDRDGSSAIVSFKRMYNGWYVGVVTPSGIYYQDVYDTAAILSLLGFVLMSILSYILLRLSAAKMRSDEENRSKSSFLARMSHEIRTPMNAILGLSELAQREYGKPKALEYITGIRSAGAGLLTIINDILDFSRIEAGNLPLHPAPYQTASLLNDVLTILRMRMSEKSLKLIVAVSPELPGSLLGDAGRGKQILLNLLSNAVKYTDEGFIRFSASGEAEGEDSIRLTFTVEDSGIGIKKEDLPKLFGEFTRIDEKRNSAIEGTGLGLIIARSLCQAMGGDITVTSEYGKGSVFTATLTQRVADRKPMGDMTRVMARREQPHSASFTAPEAEVLIVDDFPSNLLVAEGLLIPYKMRVFTCLNGREAVERVRERSFDLVFMDHMMPEMDGVEATRVIRAMKEERCRTLPIIALTANAVSGMREMFLENGFNDFLSKPIEVMKLDTVLEKWIPAGKRRDAPEERGNDAETAVPDGNPLPEIAGVDVAAGIARIGGSRSRYTSLLEMFRRDAQAGFALLEKEPDDDTLRAFITRVHGLKTTLANIGAAALSQMAALLEKAGREDDRGAIRDTLSAFRKDLAGLMARIGEVLAGMRSGDGEEPSDPTAEILARLLEALEAKDIDAIYAELPHLQSLPVTGEQREAIGEIVDFILTPDFQKAAEAINALLERENTLPASSNIQSIRDI